jgi:POT family proton-dependent oligopeptide transporter
MEESLQTRFWVLKITPFGASVMILGNLIIAFSPLHFSIWELLTIIGTGFFKPNISSMVGSFIKWGQS